MVALPLPCRFLFCSLRNLRLLVQPALFVACYITHTCRVRGGVGSYQVQYFHFQPYISVGTWKWLPPCCPLVVLLRQKCALSLVSYV